MPMPPLRATTATLMLAAPRSRRPPHAAISILLMPAMRAAPRYSDIDGQMPRRSPRRHDVALMPRDTLMITSISVADTRWRA